MSSPHPNPAESPDPNEAFDRSLHSLEASLQALKERYQAVQLAQQQQQILQQQRDEIQAQSPQSPELQLELRRIEAQLTELEFTLESRLFSWSGLRESFWQVVRFGGLGLAIGWSLAYFTLKQPSPQSPTPKTGLQERMR